MSDEPKMVFHVRDWRARYEVNAKGGEACEGDTLRLRPLEFVRWQVRGRDQGIGLRRVNKLAGDEFAPAVFGVFAKLVEIAGQENRDRRGYILTSDGEPMTAEDIAEASGWSQAVIEKALTILLNERVQWVEHVVFPEFPEVREIPAPYITKPNLTKPNGTKAEPKTRGRARAASASTDASSAGVAAPAPNRKATTPEAAANGNGIAALTRKPTDEEMRDWSQRALAAKQAGLPVPPKPGGEPLPEQPNAFGATLETLEPPQDEDPEQAKRDLLNALWQRIRKVTNDSKAYMAWWASALPAIVDHQQVHGALLEALDYASDCANDAVRASKGIGEPLENPGGYVNSKVLAAARAFKVQLPALPAKAKAGTTHAAV